ncbi:DsrE family protein [Parahaliea sp. F7430]|uniref:DsrE family protein n=1 Tax=Sediminihaliea albiluteola TaxID=2758564 RepID=A0A7W2YK73_9GAMM|nr:DsrE family protein [Sediminihaliea albiluteola]MBA6413885.1 DsrE family protein [Sediminihaliea albiluteola]
MKVLQIVEQAFRATGEEQDDTILWLSRSMRAVGAELHLLLNGNAAYYAVQQGHLPPLRFGHWQQSHPANIEQDLQALIDSGVTVSVVEEALVERGLAQKPSIKGLQRLPRKALASLYNSVDQVWQW